MVATYRDHIPLTLASIQFKHILRQSSFFMTQIEYDEAIFLLYPSLYIMCSFGGRFFFSTILRKMDNNEFYCMGIYSGYVLMVTSLYCLVSEFGLYSNL